MPATVKYSYEFVPDKFDEGSRRKKVEMEIDATQATWDALAEDFQDFLKACSYQPDLFPEDEQSGDTG